MEARFGGKSHHYYGPVVSDLKDVGKGSVEWDLNDWKWDGDLFSATPVNEIPIACRSRPLFPVTSELQATTGVSNSSSSCSFEVNLQNEKGRRELEKRRRVTALDEEEEANDEAAALNLKLGGQVYPVTEDDSDRCGKKSKVAGATANRAVCQVDDCQTDLGSAKDYHRRHKVCDLHSKATKALVSNVIQRFCQQCSRFHALEEFDEGKRSCRRRLAGHNRRRRKTHPENTVNGVSLNDERGTSYLLISLLRILSNIHSNTSDQRNDQDLVSHLLRNLASLAGTVNDRNLSGLLAASQDFPNAGTSMATTLEKEPPRPPAKKPLNLNQNPSRIAYDLPPKSNTVETTGGRTKQNNIDLNSAYVDSQDCMETFDAPDNIPMWLRRDPHKSSPPQTSGNSGSTATQSPSSSTGEAQSRTDRIIFKLFGKDPNGLPLALRNQILDWLSHSPTDIEGYIRPGCIILAVYLRMESSSWDDLCYDLSSHLRKLLDASNDSFWRTGWIYTRVLNHVAFVCNGQIVLKTALSDEGYKNSSILTIKPIAVSVSKSAQFSVKGYNISWSTSRLLCALEGNYLIQKSCSDVLDGGDSSIQSLSFSCSIPNVFGRGFIEIEDDSLSSSFFPFIVAEEDVCSEICTLERDIEINEASDDKKLEARSRALDFISEVGWLLHRSHRLSSPSTDDLFSFERFRWLVEFSVDRDWCGVVKKLLNLIFNGTVETVDYTSVEAALVEVGLVHRAVRRNSRAMVEFLLKYENGLFRADAVGPGGLTPLHVAAGKDGSEHVLDALTDDPLLVGLEAWRKCHDSSGLTPYDYASLRGHYTYIHLVQRKMNKTRSGKGHVILDIPSSAAVANTDTRKHKEKEVVGFETEKQTQKQKQKQCGGCVRKMAYYGGGRSSLAIYKPAMLSMVAIAAVCVCVALLFKSSPQVMYVFQPFIWERLKYGSS